MSKLNLVKPQGISFNVDGKEYFLVYDFNAFSELEKEFGSMQKAFNVLGESPSFTDISKIIIAGTASNEEKLTLKELGAVLTPKEVPAMLELVNEALKVAMPETEEAPLKTKTKAKN